MVWFQCEVCGENLKKPKLPNHFRICAATKLSCVDCGRVFDQSSVQCHTQCVSEAEKYGPKDQVKVFHNAQDKSNKTKTRPEVDVNVGLSSRAPWFCSLCNTHTTSRQTLLTHADGKKHRAKARAFHASQKPHTQTEEQVSDGKAIGSDEPKIEPVESSGVHDGKRPTENPCDGNVQILTVGENACGYDGKRKRDASGDGIFGKKDGAVSIEEVKIKKMKVHMDGHQNEHTRNENGCSNGAALRKIKWKKLIKSTLKANQKGGALKLKKLQKLILSSLRQAGVTEDETLLQEMLMNKIISSSKFFLIGKRVCLVKEKHNSENN